MDLAPSIDVKEAFAAKLSRLRAAAALPVVEERAEPPVDIHIDMPPIGDKPAGWKVAPNFQGWVPASHDTEHCETCQRPYDDSQDISD